jgi:hypothetical protein
MLRTFYVVLRTFYVVYLNDTCTLIRLNLLSDAESRLSISGAAFVSAKTTNQQLYCS